MLRYCDTFTVRIYWYTSAAIFRPFVSRGRSPFKIRRFFLYCREQQQQQMFRVVCTFLCVVVVVVVVAVCCRLHDIPAPISNDAGFLTRTRPTTRLARVRPCFRDGVLTRFLTVRIRDTHYNIINILRCFTRCECASRETY